MSFRVVALDEAAFHHLYGQSDAALAALGARSYVVDAVPGFPCRVSLRDAALGERVILLNHEHLGGDGPYRSRHAIFVRDGAHRAELPVGVIPDYLSRRLLSVRAFDGQDMMTDADVVEGVALAPLIARFLANARNVRLHVHTAKRGCYLACIERA